MAQFTNSSRKSLSLIIASIQAAPAAAVDLEVYGGTTIAPGDLHYGPDPSIGQNPVSVVNGPVFGASLYLPIPSSPFETGGDESQKIRLKNQ